MRKNRNTGHSKEYISRYRTFDFLNLSFAPSFPSLTSLTIVTATSIVALTSVTNFQYVASQIFIESLITRCVGADLLVLFEWLRSRMPLLTWHRIVQCDNCTSNVDYACPATGTFNICPAGSLSNNIIIRCTDGCAVAGNCDDKCVLLPTMTQLQLTLFYLHSLRSLAGVPPVGLKTSAECYQDSPTAGNAQCTFNCVNVTKLDGTVFYPLVSDICGIVNQCRGTENVTLGLRVWDKF